MYIRHTCIHKEGKQKVREGEAESEKREKRGGRDEGRESDRE